MNEIQIVCMHAYTHVPTCACHGSRSKMTSILVHLLFSTVNVLDILPIFIQ